MSLIAGFREEFFHDARRTCSSLAYDFISMLRRNSERVDKEERKSDDDVDGPVSTT